MTWVWLALAAFLSGSIPFGLLIARAKGIDIRAAGSGNIGATNVGRVLGKRWFLVVFALDFLKGLIPVLIAGTVLGTLGRMAVEPALSARWLACVLAAVLGHVFSPWIGFRGGKGVATSAGALVAVFPAMTIPAVAAFAVFFVVLRTVRIMSVASIAGAVSLSLWVATWFHLAHAGYGVRAGEIVDPRHMWAYLALAMVLGVLVVWTHRANIARLRAGTEPRWGVKKSQ